LTGPRVLTKLILPFQVNISSCWLRCHTDKLRDAQKSPAAATSMRTKQRALRRHRTISAVDRIRFDQPHDWSSSLDSITHPRHLLIRCQGPCQPPLIIAAIRTIQLHYHKASSRRLPSLCTALLQNASGGPRKTPTDGQVLTRCLQCHSSKLIAISHPDFRGDMHVIREY
jgi:hypothetical protein